MTEQEIEAVAHKVADILERRFNERQQELTAKAIDLLWNTPYKTHEDYEKELAGLSCQQIMDKLK